MFHSFRWSLLFCFVTVLWLFGACSGKGTNPEGTKADGGTTNTNKDGGGSENDNNTQPPERRLPPGDSSGNGKWPPPSGMAGLEFSLDDSANKTYKEGQLFWNGSFVYQKSKNTVTFSSAWQPTDGPFPPLYDDGPIDKGGHEPVGSKAGDHIWGVAVYVKPDPKQDLEFEYGVINDNNHWLWEGTNGLVVVKKGSTDVVKAKGIKLPSHGNIDIKITLDLSKLQKDYAVDDPKNPPLIFLKGTMTNWAHVQVQDKGKRGDDKAGDGILTFVQKQNLDYSPHFGLLQYKRHVQFVYQFTSISGREYKDADDNALADGVQAWADCNSDGKFTDDEKQKIIWEKDSRGAVKNTTIVVCEGKEPPCSKADCAQKRCSDKPVCKGCSTTSDCATNETCDKVSGKCQPKGASCTKADCGEARCKSDPVCQCKVAADCKTGEICNTQTGICEADNKCKSNTDCDKDETCDKATGRCLSKACTANDCKLARCKNDPVCANSGQGPVVYFLQPATGSTSGGTVVTVFGDRFKQGAKIEFGGNAATNIKFVSAKELTCTTPAGGAGSVDVSVINPDGKRNTFPQGFKYGGSFSGKRVDWCKIQWPNKIPDKANNVPAAKAGQPSPVIYGWVYKKGSTDTAGQGPGITAQVGIGPVGTNPSVNQSWKWFPATYLGDKAGPGNPTSNDEYKGTVTAPSAGTYDYAYRFSADGKTYRYCNPGNGNDDKSPYDTNKAPKLTAQ